MGLSRKVTQTAVFVREFFEGLGPGGWVGSEIYEPSNLPVWMKDAASYGRFPIGDFQVTLIIPNKKSPLRQIANLYRVFARMGSGPALILADDLPPKSRGVLVRMGIPHVVTGGAIYAPSLGLAYGKIKEPLAERITTDTLSPVGLKLTAAFLLKPNFFSGAPGLSELHERLRKHGGYPVSIATLSRAFQQLQEMELVEARGQGPNKRMHFLERQATWARLLEVSLETVVRRSETRNLPPKGRVYVLSGDSALAKLSDLMEPKAPTIAMSVASYRDWKKTQAADLSERGRPTTDWDAPPCVIELWREDPLFLEEEGCLNSIELALSLRGHPDERVQIALAQILERHGLESAGMEQRRGAAHG